MKQQAVELHGYTPEQVRVSGPPHWDRYFRTGSVISRDAFVARVGADSSRRLITLMTTGKTLYDYYPRVVRVLMAAIDSGRWGAAQLLVRLHPRDDLDRYDAFRGSHRAREPLSRRPLTRPRRPPPCGRRSGAVHGRQVERADREVRDRRAGRRPGRP